MKVLLILHDFLPKNRAGSELYTYYVAKALIGAGHQVHVLYAEGHATREVEKRCYDGIPCTVVKKPIAAGFNLFQEEDEDVDEVFRELLKTFDPDVVHIGHLRSLSVHIPKISRSQGIPVVFTLHDYWLRCARIILLYKNAGLCDGPEPAKCAACCQDIYTRWPIWPKAAWTWGDAAKRLIKAALLHPLERRWMRGQWQRRESWVKDIVENTSLFLAPSRFLRDTHLKDTGIPEDKLVYSDYAFPWENFSHVKTRDPQAPLHFGYIGQLRPHKGIDVLLKAFEGFIEAELYIYGEPTENFSENYRRLASQGNVHYRGPLDEEDKSVALAQLDALIVPSLWYENSPLVIHEAFMAKLPVITSNVGGMAELVPDGVCGVQFKVGDPVDLRRKLAELCQNPERILRMRAHIPSVKEIGAHIQELLTYYNQLLR